MAARVFIYPFRRAAAGPPGRTGQQEIRSAMADYTVLYWQDIPSMVEARDESGKKKVQLSARFQALIDKAAMRRGLVGTDAYIEQWRRSAGEARDGSADEVAEAVAAEFEAEYEAIREAALAFS